MADIKYIAAVQRLQALGYVWRGDEWTPAAQEYGRHCDLGAEADAEIARLRAALEQVLPLAEEEWQYHKPGTTIGAEALSAIRNALGLNTKLKGGPV